MMHTYLRDSHSAISRNDSNSIASVHKSPFSLNFMPDEFQYVGERNKKGESHGKGTLTSPHGSVYEGQWENGQLNGHGRAEYHSGDRYEGEWKDGKRHGQGVFETSGGERYDGQWKNGKRHGRGKQYHGSNGNIFEGDFRGDCFSTGKLNFPDGSYHVGGFDCLGNPHGRGKLTEADGTIFEGEWKNRRPTGAGSVTHPDGKIEQVDDLFSIRKYYYLKRKYGF